MTKGPVDTLKDLLPPLDSPYSIDTFSEAEARALKEALRDGFGDRASSASEPIPLPPDFNGGLLSLPLFCSLDEEKCGDDERSLFGRDQRDEDNDERSAFESFPLGFDVRMLRLYFDNQIDRFCQWVAPGFAAAPNRYVLRQHGMQLAKRRLFEKPWYESHALELMEFIRISAKLNIEMSILSGQLGRLVEQYCWKFRYEQDAVAGIGARKGASAGGKQKAKRHDAQQSKWQELGSDIWGRNPHLSKLAVAKLIKKQLDENRTAKHIARYISQPDL